ncbi:unnamed protein product [Cladocopium goreaui]|uniref:Uncharacterized protein n=1 Tax=Cladocopium goreaui TaxID=2562237 RepID=A0A9P1BWU7_9DINO|nr:unnamed protein product [Cladocopium goreaui]
MDAISQRAGGRVCPTPHRPVVVLLALVMQGRLLAAWQSLDAESPQPGCRLRCREEPGATWSYGRILNTADESPTLLSVRWENDTEDVQELVDVSNFEVETLPSDPLQDLLEGLESAREQDLEEAEGADAVLFTLEERAREKCWRTSRRNSRASDGSVPRSCSSAGNWKNWRRRTNACARSKH